MPISLHNGLETVFRDHMNSKQRNARQEGTCRFIIDDGIELSRKYKMKY